VILLAATRVFPTAWLHKRRHHTPEAAINAEQALAGLSP
jgi:hypothetical protein